jgi:hypothetical protein
LLKGECPPCFYSLDFFTFFDCGCADLSLKWVASYCLMLRELSISDCLAITDLGLAELAKLGPSLRQVTYTYSTA